MTWEGERGVPAARHVVIRVHGWPHGGMMVVVMGLCFILWRETVRADLEGASLPGEAVEAV